MPLAHNRRDLTAAAPFKASKDLLACRNASSKGGIIFESSNSQKADVTRPKLSHCLGLKILVAQAHFFPILVFSLPAHGYSSISSPQ